MEAFRPYLLKAGSSFALGALAAAAYVYLRVAARRTENDNPESPSSSVRGSNKLKDVDEDAQEHEEDEDFHSAESTACEEREKANGDQVGLGLKEVILGLVDRINELEARFQRYQSMKEYEGLLVELQNELRLEAARGDSLEKEVSSLEAEAMRVRDWETYGLRLLQEARNLEQENGVLKKKVKRLSRRCKEGARVVSEQRLRIQESEAMIMKSREEVAKGADVANKMDEEIGELQLVVDGLRREKVELTDKLEIAEASLTLKHEGEMITMDEYKHIINELEKLQKEFTAEVNELVYLRWTNACLRHQLMQLHERDIGPGLVPAGSVGEQHELLELDLHRELDRLAMERENSASPEVKTERESKRRALLKKLKGWVDGNHHGKMRLKASKNDAKCFGKHFASDWVEEHVHGKRSFISA
uniref:Protein CHUP1, chloroplastic n=1 Tax=Kalanchoe fedtschenkoi TaxID=63787 RepID=A0A7N0UAM2_KALFE